MTGTSILAQYDEPAVARISPQSGAVTPKLPLRIRPRIYLPWEHGTIITGVRFPRPAGPANVGLAWYPPAPPAR